MTPDYFPLAPMSPLIRGLTIAVLSLPIVLLGMAFVLQNVRLAGIAALLALLYAGVWLGCRPVYFRVTDRHLVIVFPVWQRVIPLATITQTQLLNLDQFQQRCGHLALRVGVAGLWGGFGWLWTNKAGWLEFYVSRADQMVLVERSGHLPVLITPQSPDHFIDVLGARRDQGG